MFSKRLSLIFSSVRLTISIHLKVGTLFSSSSLICAIKEEGRVSLEYTAKSISERRSILFFTSEPNINNRYSQGIYLSKIEIIFVCIFF